MVKVSVIVPVYGVEKYIDKCLNSLVNQTLNDIEIIVVNDGSPDNSQKIIDEYVKRYPKIVKSYKKSNGGQGSARNYGLKKASGEYIGYVDSDDYIEYNMYEKLYNEAKRNDLDIVICCNKNVYENTGKEKIEPLFLKTDNDKANALFSNVGVCNKLYKKEIVDNFLFKSKVWYEDLAFCCKTVMKSSKIGFVNEGLYNYLIRQGSTMNNDNASRNLEILDAFDDVLNYIDENKKYKKYYPEIEFLAIYHIFIAAIVRIITAKNVHNKKELIHKLRNYVCIKFPNYDNNQYLYLLDKNKKIVYNLIKQKKYFCVRLIFKLKEVVKR